MDFLSRFKAYVALTMVPPLSRKEKDDTSVVENNASNLRTICGF